MSDTATRETTQRIVDGLATYLYGLNQTLGTGLTRQRLQDEIDLYLKENLPGVTPLSQIEVDYEAIVLQLQQTLYNKPAWRDQITAATGQTIIEMLAQAIAFNQLGVERAAQETMLDTARMPASQYTITRHLGVHVTRKTPARTRAVLTNQDVRQGIVIEPYTPWKVEQSWFYNRDVVTFHEGDSSEVETFLYEGELIEERFTSNGEPFQRFEIGFTDFSISDVDIYVDVVGSIYRRVINGLWHYGSTDQVFYENTLPNGSVEVMFGNGIYGQVPPANTTISIRYARTKGSVGNSSTSSLRVAVPSQTTVTGVTTGTIAGGADHKSGDFYRNLAPHIYSARDRAVTRADFEALALTYQGVIDVRFRGQAEIAPTNRSWMNVISATVLKTDGTLFTDSEWADFKKFIEAKGTYGLNLLRYDPVGVPVQVEAEVYCRTGANLSEIGRTLRANIFDMFKLRRFIIGYSHYQSDVYNKLEARELWKNQISYVRLVQPSMDIDIGELEYATLAPADLQLKLSYGTRDYTNRMTGA